ncbi:MAG TPA: hypothetical protein VIC26_06790 [Marinagarivorans sp.]
MMPTQKDMCIKHGAIPCPSHDNDLMDLAKHSIGQLPINGCRRTPSDGHCGWSLWCGAETPADTAFSQLPASNVQRSLAEAYRYLALPPGYRFLIAGAYAKVWFDATLLEPTADHVST